MNWQGLNIGVCMCGSFCTFSIVMGQIEALVCLGANVIPIMSYNAQNIDTRFGSADKFKSELKKITGNDILYDIADTEPIGPKNLLDVLVVAPCTSNTMAKLCNGITDSPALMACKSHLRNDKPLVIAMATNDALGISLKNIGELMVRKNIYFVPFGQDDFEKKPLSMVAHFDEIINTIENAMGGKQIQPILV